MAYPSEKMSPRQKALWDKAQALMDNPKAHPVQVQKAQRAQAMLAGLYRNNSPEPKLALKPSYSEMHEDAVKNAERRGAPAYEDTNFAVQIGLTVMLIGETVTGILFPAGRGVPTVTALIVGAIEFHRRKRQNQRRSQMINEEFRTIENRTTGDM